MERERVTVLSGRPARFSREPASPRAPPSERATHSDSWTGARWVALRALSTVEYEPRWPPLARRRRRRRLNRSRLR